MIAEKVGRSLNQSCADSFPRCPVSLSDFFSSNNTGEVDDTATKGSFVNLNSPHPDMSENLEHSSHSSITNKPADHEFLIEKDATSVRKKDPLGMENGL